MDEKTIIRFDQYLDGAMSEREAEALEQELRGDPKLTSDFKAFHAGIVLLKTEGFNKELKDLMADSGTKNVPFHKRKVFPYLVAASISILALIGYFVFSQPLTPKELYAENYQPYQNVLLARNEAPTALTQALRVYSSKEYARALEQLERMEQSDTIQFYRAMCNLSLNKPNLALKDLNRIQPSSLFREQVIWYQGLAFLSIENPDSASYHFNRIELGAYRYEQVREILSQFD